MHLVSIRTGRLAVMVLVTMATQNTGHPMVTNHHIIFKSGRTGTETDLPNNTLQLTKQCQCKSRTNGPSRIHGPSNNLFLATMPCTEVLVNSKKLVQMATNNLLGFRVENGSFSFQISNNLFHIERNIYSANKANSKLSQFQLLPVKTSLTPKI